MDVVELGDCRHGTVPAAGEPKQVSPVPIASHSGGVALGIEAEHENGVLKIRMPKRAELKPRKVKILKPVQAQAEKPKK